MTVLSPCISIIYHSTYGHTKVQAEAVLAGVQSVHEVKGFIFSVEDVVTQWEKVHVSQALIFGCPTYMGSASAEFKKFMEVTSSFWGKQLWKDKLAAGFTNSGSQNGDKLNTLLQLCIFAAQHSMIWASLGLLPGNNTSQGSVQDLNRLGSSLGAMAQSNNDEGPDKSPPKADRETAEYLGARVARLVLQKTL